MPPIDEEVWEDRKLTGKIIRLNKTFGFIEGEDGRDYFFHWQHLSKFSKHFRNLVEGERVEFQPGRTSQGPRAREVQSLTTE